MDKVTRGLKAQALLDDELLQQSFELVRSAIIKRWEESPIADREGQHELRLMIKLLSDVQRNLIEAVNDGKVELARRQDRKLRKIA